MSTCYVDRGRVAHVLRFESAGVWQSICSYRAGWDYAENGPMKWATPSSQPAKRWCPRCVSRITELAVDVLGVQP